MDDDGPIPPPYALLALIAALLLVVSRLVFLVKAVGDGDLEALRMISWVIGEVGVWLLAGALVVLGVRPGPMTAGPRLASLAVGAWLLTNGNFGLLSWLY